MSEREGGETPAAQTEVAKPEPRPDLLGWLLLAATLFYTFAIFHGIGPRSPSADPAWYEPRGFLSGWSWLGFMLETPRRVVLGFTIPAALLATATFLTCRSAFARALALGCVVATPFFLFYGDVAAGIWTFFGWRWSAVMALTALSVGFAVAAPLLATSWLRRGWPTRILLYLPFVAYVLAFIRNATGTDPSLRFAISPWPAVPVFGIEVGAMFVAACLLGVALGSAGLARALGLAGSARTAASAMAFALGLAVVPVLLFLGDTLDLFPFGGGVGTYTAVLVVCALFLVGVATLGVKDRPTVLRRRAVSLGVGAALVGVPLLSGQAMARYDYYVAREHHAREIIDALESYRVREEIYPDELDDLIGAGDLEAIPEPSIGFGFLYDGHFRYRSFGTSFILEFPAPRWVECAYTPPYEDDDEDFLDDEEEAEPDEFDNLPGMSGDDSLDEAWSCPSKPPELW